MRKLEADLVQKSSQAAAELKLREIELEDCERKYQASEDDMQQMQEGAEVSVLPRKGRWVLLVCKFMSQECIILCWKRLT